jgi:hypothetical protein
MKAVQYDATVGYDATAYYEATEKHSKSAGTSKLTKHSKLTTSSKPPATARTYTTVKSKMKTSTKTNWICIEKHSVDYDNQKEHKDTIMSNDTFCIVKKKILDEKMENILKSHVIFTNLKIAISFAKKLLPPIVTILKEKQLMITKKDVVKLKYVSTSIFVLLHLWFLLWLVVEWN